MNLDSINAKLAWAVLVTGVTLTVLAGAVVVLTGATGGLLVAAFGAVAAQIGKISLRDNPASGLSLASPTEAHTDLVAA
jgi:ABC-type branched-subunit amino acid transport system ATPase component